MTDSLFSTVYNERRAAVAKGLPLVVALTGSTDAGNAVAQLEQFLWERCAPEEILKFDTDQFLDYRSRRPLITFDKDHFRDYSPAELILSLARDELGAPFLLLSGFEPDFKWEAFVDAVLLLVHEFEVSVTTWMQAIPMPVPHTRRLVATVSGSRDDIEGAGWKPTTRLPASVVHLLEYRLHCLGEEVVGFSQLVPHYLANNEYPALLVASLENIMAVTGLLFSTDDARQRAQDFSEQVDRQIAESEDSREMIQNLEERFDSFSEAQGEEPNLTPDESEIPSADQLASELEKFLQERYDEPEQNDDGNVQ